MPRRITGPEAESVQPKGNLAAQLADELKSDREFGQPLIYEKTFETGKARVTVIWDKWDGLPLQERTATILRAYEVVEGASALDRIALASGLTFPEAHAAGMLPFQIIAAIRKSDPVRPDEARRAMIDLGGSTLFKSDTVQLRFATEEEAAGAKKRLVEQFPGSDDVWTIHREVLAFDPVYLDDEAVQVTPQ
jgi:hypothetical protein